MKLTVDDVLHCSLDSISEYLEMCAVPNQMLVEFMAKIIADQIQIISDLTFKLESLEKSFYSKN